MVYSTEEIQEIQKAARYAASKWCPVVSWREEAASEAVVYILSSIGNYDPKQIKRYTYLVNQARWGVLSFLRSEWGREDRLRKSHHGEELKDVTYSDAVPADKLVEVAQRCDNIDKTSKTLTIAQRRGNIPNLGRGI